MYMEQLFSLRKYITIELIACRWIVSCVHLHMQTCTGIYGYMDALNTTIKWIESYTRSNTYDNQLLDQKYAHRYPYVWTKSHEHTASYKIQSGKQPDPPKNRTRTASETKPTDRTAS